MTEEIKKMAREYALNHCSALCPAGRIDFIINDFIEQLSKDYFIVPKTEARRFYDEFFCEPVGLMGKQFKGLFVKDLFEEGK